MIRVYEANNETEARRAYCFQIGENIGLIRFLQDIFTFRYSGFAIGYRPLQLIAFRKTQ